MNKEKLNKAIEKLKTDLDTGLLAVDIWDNKTGLSLASYNYNDRYSAIFGRIMNEIDRGLKDLGFPEFGEYQIIDLEMGSMLVFVKAKDKLFASCLLDKTKIQLGYLIAITLPEFRKMLEEAI